jgi:T4-like virus tail tube protein gp19
MSTDAAGPLLNTCFRVEIEGLSAAGCIEVIFPEARIIGAGRLRTVQYGPLTLRRGLRVSSDWYQWWERCRGAGAPLKKRIAVVLMDRQRADRARWTFSGALPAAYTVSPLNAAQAAVLIETLELSVSGLAMELDGRKDSPRARRAAKRSTPARARR